MPVLLTLFLDYLRCLLATLAYWLHFGLCIGTLFPISPLPFHPPYWLVITRPQCPGPTRCKAFLLQSDLYLTYLGLLSEEEKMAEFISLHTSKVLLCLGGTGWDYHLTNAKLFRQVITLSGGGNNYLWSPRGITVQQNMFRTMATSSGWNKPALKLAFRHGMNDDILTEMACRDDQATIDLLIDLAIHLDNPLCKQNHVY